MLQRRAADAGVVVAVVVIVPDDVVGGTDQKAIQPYPAAETERVDVLGLDTQIGQPVPRHLVQIIRGDGVILLLCINEDFPQVMLSNSRSFGRMKSQNVSVSRDL